MRERAVLHLGSNTLMIVITLSHNFKLGSLGWVPWTRVSPLQLIQTGPLAGAFAHATKSEK
jgi:hypothetical protein